jgi:hypothetical protein
MSQFDKMQGCRLDGCSQPGDCPGLMTRITLTITLAAAAALAGCNSKDHTIVAGPPDDTATNSAENAHVALPPSIASSKSYRCADNKLVYIDWMSDGTARVKKSRDEVGTPVTTGTNLKGEPGGSTITYNGQGCKA